MALLRKDAVVVLMAVDWASPAHRRSDLQTNWQAVESQFNLDLGRMPFTDINGGVPDRRDVPRRCRSPHHETDVRAVRNLFRCDTAGPLGRCRRTAAHLEDKIVPAKSLLSARK